MTQKIPEMRGSRQSQPSQDTTTSRGRGKKLRDDEEPTFNTRQSKKKKQVLSQFGVESESENSSSTSYSPDEEVVNNSNLDPVDMSKLEEGDVIRHKNSEVHESIQ